MGDTADSVTNDTVSSHSDCAVSVRNSVILQRLCLIEQFLHCVTNLCSEVSRWHTACSLLSLNRVAMEVICKM